MPTVTNCQPVVRPVGDTSAADVGPTFVDPIRSCACTPVVNVDPNGFWGETTSGFQSNTQLVYGTDYFLQIDSDDGSSKSGLLIRRGDWWPKTFSRQRGLLAPYVTPGYGSVKVTYSAGYTLDTLPSAIRAACELTAQACTPSVSPGRTAMMSMQPKKSCRILTWEFHFSTTPAVQPQSLKAFSVRAVGVIACAPSPPRTQRQPPT